MITKATQNNFFQRLIKNASSPYLRDILVCFSYGIFPADIAVEGNNLYKKEDSQSERFKSYKIPDETNLQLIFFSSLVEQRKKLPKTCVSVKPFNSWKQIKSNNALKNTLLTNYCKQYCETMNTEFNYGRLYSQVMLYMLLGKIKPNDIVMESGEVTSIKGINEVAESIDM